MFAKAAARTGQALRTWDIGLSSKTSAFPVLVLLEGEQRSQSKRDQAGDVTVAQLALQECSADREGWDGSGEAELPLVLPTALT